MSARRPHAFPARRCCFRVSRRHWRAMPPRPTNWRRSTSSIRAGQRHAALGQLGFFKAGSECETVSEAILRLVFREIYRLAVTTLAAVGSTTRCRANGWEPGDFCRHSLCVAVAAETLAAETGKLTRSSPTPPVLSKDRKTGDCLRLRGILRCDTRLPGGPEMRVVAGRAGGFGLPPIAHRRPAA
jgi:hypothetical protein